MADQRARTETAVALIDSALRRAEDGAVAEALRLADDGMRLCLEEAERLSRTGRVEPALLAALGVALRFQHAYGADVEVLEDAVEALRAGVGLISAEHPSYAALLFELGSALLAWHEVRGDPADLDEAVEVLRRALMAMPPGSPHRSPVLSHLALALRDRFHRSMTETDLDDAVASLRAAIEAVPVDSPDTTALANLGALLLTLAEYRADPASLDEAVSVLREVVVRMSDGHPMRATVLSNLSTALRMRHRYSGDAGDAVRAVDIAREAVARVAAEAPEYPALVAGLVAALEDLHAISGDPVVLAEARALASRVTPAVPPDEEVVDVLLAERDEDLAAALIAGLARSGLTSRRVTSAVQVLGRLAGVRRGVVLDLPHAEAPALAERIAIGTDLHVVVLTGSDTPAHRVADPDLDRIIHLAKPIDVDELAGHLRRVSRASEARTPRRVEVGDLVIDDDRREVRVAGALVAMSHKQYAVLWMLAREPGAVRTRQEILQEVWGTAAAGSARSLDVHVATLRSKLRGSVLIETVRGVGYRLRAQHPEGGATG